jgi:hypothetical protein
LVQLENYTQKIGGGINAGNHTFVRYFAKEFGRESEGTREADGLIFCELPTLTWLGQ